ncbi:patatin-like phospholipase family protein [Pelagovum pacificum]|uniref:Patatin-like phospholipase family protein n=1 Tax=Pelagovum pacificum TaxID=2588711 RepID=A0A5C5GBC5_9RHOB|nr:patatin-like phospholipase family protein [Pelagovum pacificum]QQA44777.1 patatin-like phospholipase family protein [Pelagovum pacificum]TNY32115.1 patatin-like phospholipase family protein [Pelagovum pacificum]
MAEPKRINLALQGGGAHGAFTWGVLDRLLEDGRVEIAAMSGTSAGALNAAALKAGLVEDGNDGARARLDWLWTQVGAVTDNRLTAWIDAFAPSAPALAKAIEYSPAFAAFDISSRMMSPYVYGSVFKNPLRHILSELAFDHVCAADGPELYICATNVRSGKIRVFSGEGITADAVLASACLPTLFQAVEIDGEAYWDGGYTGNPALFPLYARHLPDDVVIVNINPLYREEVPTYPQAIQNRINEISFNSSLLRELRAVSFVHRLLGDGAVQKGAMKEVLVHMISDDMLMNELNIATKMVPTPVVLARLKAAGREAAEKFLDAHWSDLNERGTVDLREMFS